MTVAAAIEAGGENGGFVAAVGASMSPGAGMGSGAFRLGAGPSAAVQRTAAIEASKSAGSAAGSMAAKSQDFRTQWGALIQASAAKSDAGESVAGEARLNGNLAAQPSSERAAPTAPAWLLARPPVADSAPAGSAIPSAANPAGRANQLRNALSEGSELRAPGAGVGQEASSDATQNTARAKKPRDANAAKDAEPTAQKAGAEPPTGAAAIVLAPTAAPSLAPPPLAASSWRLGNPQAEDEASGEANASSIRRPAMAWPGPVGATAQGLTLPGAKPNAVPPPGVAAGRAARMGRQSAGAQGAEGIPEPGVAGAVPEERAGATTSARTAFSAGEAQAALAAGRQDAPSQDNASNLAGVATPGSVARGSGLRRTTAAATAEAGSNSGSSQSASDKEPAMMEASYQQAEGASAPGVHARWTQMLSAEPSAQREVAAGTGTAGILALDSAPGLADARGIGTRSSAGSVGRDVFTTLDSGSSVGAPTLIHAGGQRAEAGFEDPTLGWVGVRADMAGNGIHAALVPGSEQAAQVLSTHMAGLSAHLSDEHSPVSTLTMAHPGQSGIASGMDEGRQQGNQNEGQRNPGAGQVSEPAEGPGVAQGVSPVDSGVEAGDREVAKAPLDGIYGATRSGRISVMA